MAWDPNVPATNAPLLSAPIRANFQALDALMSGGGGVTFPLLAPDGTVTAPSYSFANDHDTGFYYAGGSILFTGDGTRVLTIGGSGTYIDYYKLTLRDLSLGIVPGVSLWPENNHILAQKDGANLQKFRVYGDATNYLEVGGGSIEFWVPAVPGTPATGRGVLYMKSDKKLYFKNDAGTETALF